MASLDEYYAGGGFGHALQPGQRPALIVVDFVMAYLKPGSPLYAGDETTRDACAVLLRAARDAGIPVLHTNVRFQAGGRDGGVFFRKLPALGCFADGADPELSRFDQALEPAVGETVITKQYASAFFGTTLASTLTALGVDTLLIAGVSSERLHPRHRTRCLPARFHPLGRPRGGRRSASGAPRSQPFRPAGQVRRSRGHRNGSPLPRRVA